MFPERVASDIGMRSLRPRRRPEAGDRDGAGGGAMRDRGILYGLLATAILVALVLLVVAVS